MRSHEKMLPFFGLSLEPENLGKVPPELLAPPIMQLWAMFSLICLFPIQHLFTQSPKVNPTCRGLHAPIFLSPSLLGEQEIYLPEFV